MTIPIDLDTNNLITISFLVGAILMILLTSSGTLKTNTRRNSTLQERNLARAGEQEVTQAPNQHWLEPSDTQITVCYQLPTWTMGLIAWCLESLVTFSYNVLVGTPPSVLRVAVAGFMAGFIVWFHSTLHRLYLLDLAAAIISNPLITFVNKLTAKPWLESVLGGVWLSFTFAAYNTFVQLVLVPERVAITILVMFTIGYIPARYFRAEINRVEALSQQSRLEMEKEQDAFEEKF